METLPSTTPGYQPRRGHSLHLADLRFHGLAVLKQLEA